MIVYVHRCFALLLIPCLGEEPGALPGLAGTPGGGARLHPLSSGWGFESTAGGFPELITTRADKGPLTGRGQWYVLGCSSPAPSAVPGHRPARTPAPALPGSAGTPRQAPAAGARRPRAGARTGGDLANTAPEPVTFCTPAGAVLYCRSVLAAGPDAGPDAGLATVPTSPPFSAAQQACSPAMRASFPLQPAPSQRAGLAAALPAPGKSDTRPLSSAG